MMILDDERLARRFFSVMVSPYFPSSAHIEIRCFPPKWRVTASTDQTGRVSAMKQPRDWFPITEEGIRQAARFAIAHRERYEVYYGVLPRVQGGGTAAHLRQSGWIWVDLDAGEDDLPTVCELLRRGVSESNIPYPNLVIVSGFGLHCYWRLAEVARTTTADEQMRLRTVNIRLGLVFNDGRPIAHDDTERTAHAHACPKATDAARILRVPGTLNLKCENEQRLVRVAFCQQSRENQTLLWWEANLPAIPLPRPVKAYSRRGDFSGRSAFRGSSIASTPSLPPRTRDKIATGAAPGMRHYTMVDVAVSARKEGYDEAEIAALVDATGRASGLSMETPHEARHAAGVVQWAVNNVAPSPYGR